MAERRFYQGETFANYDPGELLENAEFEDCVFDHCRWLGTRVQNCRFNACTFDHCNFSGVVFSFTTMKDASAEQCVPLHGVGRAAGQKRGVPAVWQNQKLRVPLQ